MGGRLVYSTCTFNPVEDEAVVAEVCMLCLLRAEALWPLEGLGQPPPVLPASHRVGCRLRLPESMPT